jgi:hypothetical protein
MSTTDKDSKVKHVFKVTMSVFIIMIIILQRGGCHSSSVDTV